MFTLGTAGHIDHGKTTLTRLLTGKDTDRLPEERARGISIELGFAPLEIGGTTVGLVDVPGHEKFVHNMVAGVAGISGFLLVVAADEGLMPQTREHLEILRLLGIRKGLVVVSKSDLADPDMQELVRLEVEEALEKGGLLASSIRTYSSQVPESLEEVREGIRELLGELESVSTRGVFRLPVDRVFTVKGHGTVVTGTVSSGRVEVGQELALLPQGKTSRVRSIQTFDEDRTFAQTGERTALNLPDLSKEEVVRGSVLVKKDAVEAVSILDVDLEWLESSPEARSGSRYRFHLGTAAQSGRLHILGKKTLGPGQRAKAQLRLDQPLVALPQDRFLVRALSPPTTLGGGTILDMGTPRYKRGSHVVERLEAISEKGLEGAIVSHLESSQDLLEPISQLSQRLVRPEKEVRAALKQLPATELARREGPGGPFYGIPRRLERVESEVLAALAEHHRTFPEEIGPARDALARRKGIALPPDRLAWVLLDLGRRGKILEEKGRVRLPSHETGYDGSSQGIRKVLLEFFARSETPFHGRVNLAEAAGREGRDFDRALDAMQKTGELVRLPGDIFTRRETLEGLQRSAFEVLDRSHPEPVETKDFKEALGLTRKGLIPLLEGMDEAGMTLRTPKGRIRRPGFQGFRDS